MQGRFLESMVADCLLRSVNVDPREEKLNEAEALDSDHSSPCPGPLRQPTPRIAMVASLHCFPF